MDGQISSDVFSGRPLRSSDRRQSGSAAVNRNSLSNERKSPAADGTDMKGVDTVKANKSKDRRESPRTMERSLKQDRSERESLGNSERVSHGNRSGLRGQKTGDEMDSPVGAKKCLDKTSEESMKPIDKNDQDDSKGKSLKNEEKNGKEFDKRDLIGDKKREAEKSFSNEKGALDDTDKEASNTGKQKPESGKGQAENKERERALSAKTGQNHETFENDEIEIIDVESGVKKSLLIKDRSPSNFMVPQNAKSMLSVNTGNADHKLIKMKAHNNKAFMNSAMGYAAAATSNLALKLTQSGMANARGLGMMGVSNSHSALAPNFSSQMNHLAAGFHHLPHSNIQQNSVLYSRYNNKMPMQSNFQIPSLNLRFQMNSPPTMVASVPEKATSSKEMIDMIRWEVESRINIKPFYVKPNPKAELGNMAKWLFDLGSDIVKESVYNDLVHIQRHREEEGTLSTKEKDDLLKLQDIKKDLNDKVGHLKYRARRGCRCGFRTDLKNVLYYHQQHAHCEMGGILNCALCKYSTRQHSAFRAHMKNAHNRIAMMEKASSLYECSSCVYETNQLERMEQHKLRCKRQFREDFNLHPGGVTGPEICLCLENVFYMVFNRLGTNSFIPKQPSLPSPAPKDMVSKPMTPARMMQQSAVVNARTSLAVNAQMGPRPHVAYSQGGASMGKQNLAYGGAQSQNVPVASSQINSSPNDAVSRNHQQLSQMNHSAFPKQAHSQPNSGFEVCELCGGYVKDRKALRIHFFCAHRIDMPLTVFERPQPPLYCATCFIRFWTAQGLQKHIEVHKKDLVNASQSGGSVAGKCISCGHRVPNILMHMRMVHNREMRHYLAAQMCIFCGNRFATKREVENHIGRVHGVIVKGSDWQSRSAPPNKPHPSSQAKPNMHSTTGTPSASSTPSRKPGKSKCVLCNMTFDRTVDLTRHCMRVHHTCMKCGLVVVDKESLARHTCLHSASGMRTCEICKETGFHPAYHIKHLRDKHLKKCYVVLRHIDRAVIETMKRPISISSDSDSSEDEESVSKGSSPKRPKLDPESTENQTEDKIADQSESQEEDEKTTLQPEKPSKTVPKKEKDNAEKIVGNKEDEVGNDATVLTDANRKDDEEKEEETKTLEVEKVKVVEGSESDTANNVKSVHHDDIASNAQENVGGEMEGGKDADEKTDSVSNSKDTEEQDHGVSEDQTDVVVPGSKRKLDKCDEEVQSAPARKSLRRSSSSTKADEASPVD